MDMVEKVARAIWTMRMEGGWNSYDELPDNRKATVRTYARAAIEAMREPTELMFNAGHDCAGFGVDDGWPAMIDAALAEAP